MADVAQVTERFPTLAELQLIAAIEDHFDMADAMDELLEEWHQVKLMSLTDIAHQWSEMIGQSITESFIQYVMERYGIDEVEIPEVPDVVEEPAPASDPIPPTDDIRLTVFRGNGSGMISNRIVMTFQQKQSWPATLTSLQQLFPDLTMDTLRQWVHTHMAGMHMLGSDAVTALIEGEDTLPTKPDDSPVVDEYGFVLESEIPRRFRHEASGMLVTAEVRIAFIQACRYHDFTVKELCTPPFYDPAKARDIAAAMGIPDGVYSELAKHFATCVDLDAAPAQQVVKHPSGVELSGDDIIAIEKYCQNHGCSEQELFTERFDATKIADTANAIGITPPQYMALWQYWKKQEVSTT